ncbi:MAG: Holliday junction branch migration protein RuvA [Flavobacteriales bacterium]|nr:Holliday junction branch migration protein RuvA [Flavobacteriales bacterium]
MIHHLRGRLIEKSPTHAVIECGGVGYFVHISLHTFSRLPDDESCMIYTHQVIREDAHQLFGFADDDERKVFIQLTSVSGVGAATGRMILSSLSPDEVRHAILAQDVSTIQAVKGIGAKTAQRIIVDLHDKIQKGDEVSFEKITVGGNSTKSEALSALSSLGFDKAKADKTLDKILMQEGEGIALEELIKRALKQL